jgi:hypothetical protein
MARILSVLLIIVVAAGTYPGTSAAQAASTCSVFAGAIDDAEKSMSAEHAEGVADNSAPRATLREQRIANYLQAAAINLTLMTRHNCPPRKMPIDTRAYYLDALKCGNAQMQRSSSAESPPECDRAKWQRMFGDSAGPERK